MIKRRLVGGILLLVVACLELVMAHGYYRMYFYDATTQNMWVINKDKALLGSYSLYAVLALAVGIFFLATCKKQPVKWFEYTLFGVMIVFYVLIFPMAPNAGTEGGLFGFMATIQFFCYVLGAPMGATGFKDFPFKNKDDAHSEKSIDKLTKLKELLDSGAITQEEFDQEKKKIWK